MYIEIYIIGSLRAYKQYSIMMNHVQFNIVIINNIVKILKEYTETIKTYRYTNTIRIYTTYR